MATIQASGTLAERLAPQRVLSLPDALALVRAVASQAAQLHSSGQAHGNIACATIVLDAEGRPLLIPDERGSTAAEATRTSVDCRPRGRGARYPQKLKALLPGHSSDDGRRAVDSSFALGAREPNSLQGDVYALAALLCRLLTGASADAYLRSPRMKSLVAEPLQPFLDRILGCCSSEAIPDAPAFLKALDAALSGPSSEAPVVTSGPSDDSVSEMNLETVEVDSSCVSGLDADERRILPPRKANADTAELPFQTLGHYEIRGRLGRGGMGEVYLGYESRLDRQVAIKVLPARFASDAELIRRFQAEATAAARLIHPNIIQIYYIGEDAGHHFFAMQYVAGVSLARLLSQHRMTVDEAVAVFEEVLSGLAAAHKLAMVHRDVKPANILIDKDLHRALLADFGLVKSLEDAARERTATGIVMGTADYMSPEQGLGQPVDGRSDLYSAGIVMHQMLCGRLPFIARESSAVIYHHVHVPPPPIAGIAPHVPAALAAVVAKLLAKSPDDRYQTAGAALADLRKAVAGQPIDASVLHGSGAAQLASTAGEIDTSVPLNQLTETTRIRRPGTQLSRRKMLLAGAAGAGLAVLSVGLWNRLRPPRQEIGPGFTLAPDAGRNPAEVREFRDNPSEVNCFAITADERTLIVGDRTDKLVLWNFRTTEPGRTMRAHSGPIRRLILTANGQFAVTASADQTLKMWNTKTWKQVTQLVGHVDIVTSVAQVPGRDEVVSSSFDGRLCRWSLAAGSPLIWYGKDPIDPQDIPQGVDRERQDRHISWVRDVVLPGSGDLVISGGNDCVILIWDLESGQVVDRLIEHRGPVMCLAISRDGTRLLSGGFDKAVCLWDFPERRLVRRLPHDSATPACVALSPDGLRAVAGGGDGLIRVWDVATGAELQTLEAHVGTVSSIRFTEDGRHLVSGGEDRTVRVWRLPEGS